MKQYTINTQTFNCPTSWDDITLEQFQQFEELSKKDDLEFLYVMTGVKPEDWKRSTDIQTYQQVVLNLGFLATIFNTNEIKKVVFKGKEYTLKDLAQESIGQYWDIVKLFNQFVEVEDRQFDSEAQGIYVSMIAIYFQGMEGNYDYVKAMDLRDEVRKMSVPHVIAMGNFFLKRYSELNLGMLNALRQGQEIVKSGKP